MAEDEIQASYACDLARKSSVMKALGAVVGGNIFNPNFVQCMTTSTAGMSFNSPPATARDLEYDNPTHGGEILDNGCMGMGNYCTMDKFDSGNHSNAMLYNADSNKKQRPTNSSAGNQSTTTTK